jgi:hypothetical protein
MVRFSTPERSCGQASSLEKFAMVQLRAAGRIVSPPPGLNIIMI